MTRCCSDQRLERKGIADGGSACRHKCLGKIQVGRGAGVMLSEGEWEERVRGRGPDLRKLSNVSTAQGGLDSFERDAQESSPRSALGFCKAD